MSIEIRNLTFSYGEDAVLNDISLTVTDGQLLGIVGKTGSGKSTFVQIIAGLINGACGELLIDGENILDKRYNKLSLRKKLGIVFQYPEMQLFEQTVERELLFGLKHFELSRDEKLERILWAMHLLGLNYDAIKKKSPFTLSGGERRKVALAGILVCKPEYLILDEPIAGLDPCSRNDFMKMLVDLKNQGTTILMVSHNADCLAEYADRMIVLDDGRIVMDGKPDAVYSNPEKLISLGIGVCSTANVRYLLSENGVELPQDDICYDSLLKDLCERFSK